MNKCIAHYQACTYVHTYLYCVYCTYSYYIGACSSYTYKLYTYMQGEGWHTYVCISYIWNGTSHNSWDNICTVPPVGQHACQNTNLTIRTSHWPLQPVCPFWKQHGCFYGTYKQNQCIIYRYTNTFMTACIDSWRKCMHIHTMKGWHHSQV